MTIRRGARAAGRVAGRTLLAVAIDALVRIAVVVGVGVFIKATNTPPRPRPDQDP